LVCFAMFVIGVSMPSSASDDSDNQQPKKEVVETSPTPEAVVPDIELANDYEKAVWQIALDNDGKLISVSDEDDAIYFDIKCKNDEKVYEILINEFIKHSDNVPLYAGYLAKYGDERALPFLMTAIENEKISYADFEELRFAIEALGGTYDKIRDFKSDKSFKKIKGAKK